MMFFLAEQPAKGLNVSAIRETDFNGALKEVGILSVMSGQELGLR
jgi:hypothetical protein